MDWDYWHTGPHLCSPPWEGMAHDVHRCPHCPRDQIVKRGKTARGTQRYLCQNTRCTKGSFLLDSCNRGCLPDVKHTIIDMSLNASGVRDTARSLPICPKTVLRELKKKEAMLESVEFIPIKPSGARV